jgi:predicted nucleic acid-binding protein
VPLERILNARSDDLARAQGIAAGHPDLCALAGPFEHLPLVIDTNRVLQDVGWLARRQDPQARNFLQELCASAVVSLYAPEQLIDEVESHLSVIAENLGITRERVVSAWESYQTIVNIIPREHLDLPQADASSRDPTDLPFIAAQEAVGAHGIISSDKDLVAMGALIVKHEVLRLAREFARNRSIVVQGEVGGTAALTVGAGLIYGACKGAAALFRGYRRLPGWLQALIPLALVVATTWVVFRPASRKKLRGWIERAKPRLIEARARAGDFLEQYLAEMQEAEGKAKAALDALRNHCPLPTRKPTLRLLAYRACVASRQPLATEQIEARVRQQGYKSKAKDLQRYLRSVLRKDSRLVSVGDGWTLSRRPLPVGRTVEAGAIHGM